MSRPWETRPLTLSEPKTGLVQAGRKKVHSVYENNTIEMVEEYDVITDKLLVRKWRRQTQLGGDGAWEVEVGDEGRASGSEFLVAASTQPTTQRLDTDQLFEWRIRNLPHPKEVYQVTCSGVEIVVRTTNKKFFKKIQVPDMARASLPLDASSLTWTYAHNTLVISYVKPDAILKKERLDAKERATMKCMRAPA